MDGLVLAAGLDVVSNDDPSTPPAARVHNRAPIVEELDAIDLNLYGVPTTDRYASTINPVEPQTPHEARTPRLGEAYETRTPGELEKSQPPTPRAAIAASVVPGFFYPRMNKWRVLAACLEYFGNGMNDAAPGALLPYIESWYDIGYAVVSCIWIANAVGFIMAAFTVNIMAATLGRAKTLMLSEGFIVAAYVVIACPVPFAAVVVAYLVLGYGAALNLALNNVFCANLANSTVVLGVAHGSYGVGGILGPILATALVSNGIHWSRFFLVPIAIRIMCIFSTGWAWQDYEKEGTTQFANSLQQLASRQEAAETGENSKSKPIWQALKYRVTICGALFIFAYQGAEVSESGWFISYLIKYRKADPAHVGYVTSGFWAGITLGRFTLTHLAPRAGEKIFVVGLTVGAIVLQLMAWFVPNVIGEAVAVAILGLLLGPVYPCASTIFTRLLPANVQVFAIGFISSAGSSGGAFVPFITGLVAQGAGTFVLNPICIGAFCAMLGCWSLLPRLRKRNE